MSPPHAAHIQVDPLDLKGKSNEEHIQMALKTITHKGFKENSWLWLSVWEAALTFRLNKVHLVLGSMVIRHGRKHMNMRRLSPLHKKGPLLTGLRKWVITVFCYMPEQSHTMPWWFQKLLLVSVGCTNSILTIQIWKSSGQQVWRSAVRNLTTLQPSSASMMC